MPAKNKAKRHFRWKTPFSAQSKHAALPSLKRLYEVTCIHMNDRKNATVLQSVDNALAMIELLSTHMPLGVADAAKLLGLSKSSAFRLLSTLEARQFVRRDKNAKFYLGLKIANLGAKVLHSFDIAHIAHPFLEQLCVAIDETVHLVVLTDDYKACFIDKVVSTTTTFRMESSLGAHKPAHITGTGKVLLAYQSEDVIDRYLATTKLLQYTETSITQPDALRKILAEIRMKGYGIDDGESEQGLFCIAAPVFDENMKAIAAISASGPKERMQVKYDIILPNVKIVCAKVTQGL